MSSGLQYFISIDTVTHKLILEHLIEMYCFGCKCGDGTYGTGIELGPVLKHKQLQINC